ncbi:DUF4129 domain-containing protein [Bacillus mangrovi]|uniref:DUF4129 domain-containing protein n=1 Tax=Metabacillus mangrovi TaxID=1491830 RepID=A0A7X2S7Z8_9BACI|nr:transglutaminaseTgpA domain-containing protein [Metabacillus mangrovi]MTH55322.1 DUF4129 domain-containing protein [Metabacillus mangrovi]
MRVTSPPGNRPLTAALYCLFAFLLLWEWLVPLDVYTDTGSTGIFVAFIALNFLLTYFRVTWLISVPLQLLFVMGVLRLMFYGKETVIGAASSFIGELAYNISLVPASSWIEMTAPFRTFLFFVLLWLLVYLLHYWIIIQKRILFFFVMTLIYITVLDTFTEYDASAAVIRVAAAGFVLLGMLNFDRLKGMEKLKLKKYTGLKWTMMLAVFIAASILAGVSAPKAAPQWEDPVPFLTSYGSLDEADGGSGMKRIGYGTNDRNLGGAFMQDDTPVFTATSERRHYWRVESKDIYTGKGWTARKGSIESKEKDRTGIRWSEEGTRTERLKAKIQIADQYRYNHVIYPLGFYEYVSGEADGLLVNPDTQLITPDGLPENEKIRNYEVRYDYPSYNLEVLKGVTDGGEVPAYLMNRYTQLPDELPQRVLDLAAGLTEGKENWYDKAKAIEAHLNSSDFTYNTQEVGTPAENQDYVDQFLFETMQGYCDNFSTSMTVLLRASGIPARWVKGYTEGEYRGFDSEGGGRTYEVTNNNAHSWVEVYFPGAGWVTFEPTKGFSNPYYFTENTDTETPAPAPETQPETETPERPQDNPSEPQNEASKQTFDWSTFSFGNPGFYILAGILAAAAAGIYATRKKWLAAWAVLRYKNRSDGEVFFLAYPALLKQLDRAGIRRREGETLREYAKNVDYSLSTRDMLHITSSYEKALYKRDDAKAEWDKVAELWENLIKRTSY